MFQSKVGKERGQGSSRHGEHRRGGEEENGSQAGVSSACQSRAAQMVPNAPSGTSHQQLIEAEKGIGSVSLDGFSARDSPVRGQLGRKGPLAVSVEAAEKRSRGLGRPSSHRRGLTSSSSAGPVRWTSQTPQSRRAPGKGTCQVILSLVSSMTPGEPLMGAEGSQPTFLDGRCHVWKPSRLSHKGKRVLRGQIMVEGVGIHVLD